MQGWRKGWALGLWVLLGWAQAAIVIGQSAPLSGVAGEYGRQVAQGARAYFLWLNETEGGINGEEIKHVLYDDGFDRQRTLANTRALIETDRAVALMGYFDADAVAEILRKGLLETNNIALVGVASGNRSLREPGSPNLFHTRAGLREEIQKLVTQMKGLGVDRFAVFYQDDAFGRDGLAAAQEAAKSAGLALADSVTFPRNGEQVGAAASQLAKLNPPAVLMVSTTRPSGAFIKQFREQGGGAMLYHTSTVDFEQLVKEIGGERAHGLAIAQVYPYPWDGQSKLIREFRQAIQEYASTSTPMSYAALEGYLTARLLAEAIRRAGPQPSRDKVLKSLAGIGEVNFGGYRLEYNGRRRDGSRFVELTIVNQKGELSR